MLDVTQLRAALAVRDEGTVTRAAERLGLTQPSVSRLLSALEATLGYPLFERRRARLLLSDRGRLLLAEAERTLVALTRLADVGRELGRGGRGVLRIASIPALMQGLLPLAIEVFHLDAPDVLVELEEMLRGPMVRAVQQGTVDLGFASLPIGAQGMSIEAVAEAEAVCLVPEGHVLARKKVIRAQDLEGVPLIAGRQETLLRQRVDDAFARVGQQPRIAIVADGTPLAAALVGAGLGIAITHPVPHRARPPGIAARPFLPHLTFAYAALYLGKAPTDGLTATFLHGVRRAAAMSPPFYRAVDRRPYGVLTEEQKKTANELLPISMRGT